MTIGKHMKMKGSRGQSLVETALIVPLLLLIVLNVVNFGYFFWVTLNLTAASRTATLYSIMGTATPAATQVPPPGSPSNTLSVSYLTVQDMTGPLAGPSAASIQVCSPINLNGLNSGVNNFGTASQKSNCVTCTGSSCGAVNTGSPTPNADPEAPDFVLNRVDIVYTFQPLISGTPFNLALRASGMCNTTGTCTFARHAEMRSMN
jgi:Flp pilus assembly protein TadG